ncbi:DUF58 domain-containing protein [Alteromonas sp. a30]|uniref:DUF58 domain-containing protein n=1 Tax=Alteromonas sp. a30 TaxID=2730917 RepID=UPI002282FB72|nr:DUF58 domain-containing protein [Alteromonas sp. a30]MCY7296978.1 DUF58 domain-containing protein [Alteromonas sp. a30]
MNSFTLWNKRMLMWLDKRIPSERKFQLGMDSIFIFPSKFGVLFIGLCIGLFILGSNYSNNLLLLLCFFLVSLFLINLTASYSNFSKIQLQIGRIHPIFAGEESTFPIWFSHVSEDESQLPYKGKIYLKRFQQKTHTTFDPAHATNPINLAFGELPRGKHSIPRITVESYYPLGLYRCWTHLKFKGEVIVYPKPLPLSHFPILSGHANSETSGAKSQQGQEDFETLTSYRQGDPMHRIAWKLVAKRQALVSKQFSTPLSETLWLSLNQMPTRNIEEALSYLCWLVNECHKSEVRYGLHLGNTSIEPQNGAAHREACLHALALYPNERSS